MSLDQLRTLVSNALPDNQWVNLAQVISLFRNVDPDFSASQYGFEKLRPLLESVPDLVELEKIDSVFPPSYKCRLINQQPAGNESIEVQNTSEHNFRSLFKKYKKQPAREVFATFPYNEEIGENWESPFEKLSKKAKKETWNFQSSAFRVHGQNFIILRSYLNYTFLRIQQQEKVVYSNDGNRACFNTGLQTPTEKDIYATFYRNKKASQYNQPQWTFYSFEDSYSDKIKDYNPLPEVATYITDSSDLVFDLSYEIEINVEHIAKENQSRLPEVFHGNERLAMTAIQGATEFLKEKIRRNYKVAIPHWYHDKIQLLLPLNLQSDDKADLALVADKDKDRKIYRIKTALTMDMAYIDARLICRPDREWLNP